MPKPTRIFVEMHPLLRDKPLSTTRNRELFHIISSLKLGLEIIESSSPSRYARRCVIEDPDAVPVAVFSVQTAIDEFKSLTRACHGVEVVVAHGDWEQELRSIVAGTG